MDTVSLRHKLADLEIGQWEALLLDLKRDIPFTDPVRIDWILANGQYGHPDPMLACAFVPGYQPPFDDRKHFIQRMDTISRLVEARWPKQARNVAPLHISGQIFLTNDCVTYQRVHLHDAIAIYAMRREES